MVGRNAAEVFIEKGFKILTPTRRELDLMDSVEVMRYFKSNQIDIVLTLPV